MVGTKRIVGPSGNWEYDQLIGAKVRVNSMPVSNFFCPPVSSDLLTIKEIYFRISLDGKAITMLELLEWPGKFLTWKDVEVIEINPQVRNKAICGGFISGQALCSYGVDTKPSYLDDVTGVTIIDENGTVISSKFIRFTGAVGVVSSNEITDINFNGSLL